MGSLKIHIIPALTDNFIYALSDQHGRCAIIDPGEANAVRDFLKRENLKLSHILCTHHHWDHTNGVAELVQEFQVPVWASEIDGKKIPLTTAILLESQGYELLGEEMKVIEVPGHTLGQISFWFPQMQALFVGDTLFSCGCGRLFEGTYQQLFSSLQKLTVLPPTTQIYFGHEYTLKNIQFLMDEGIVGPDLENYLRASQKKVTGGLPTAPSELATELKLNPFLKAANIAELRKWREAKNNWKS